VQSLRDLFACLPPPAHAFAKSPVGTAQALTHRAMEDWKAGSNGREMQLGVITHQEP
jgi:hypothetical protein